MLQKYAKTQSLRVYLFSYSQFYDNISIDWITENFDMSSSEVQSAVSKMMINEELKASWDEPSRSLVLHKTEPTRLQVNYEQESKVYSIFRTSLSNLLLDSISWLRATSVSVNPSRDRTSPPSTNPTVWEVNQSYYHSRTLLSINSRLVSKQQPSVLSLIQIIKEEHVSFKQNPLTLNRILLNNRNHLLH